MDPADKAELERLRSMMVSSRAATAAWREVLIECLGDRMCGSGDGPTPEQLQTLASLEEAEQRALENYLMFVVSSPVKRSSPPR